VLEQLRQRSADDHFAAHAVTEASGSAGVATPSGFDAGRRVFVARSGDLLGVARRGNTVVPAAGTARCTGATGTRRRDWLDRSGAPAVDQIAHLMLDLDAQRRASQWTWAAVAGAGHACGRPAWVGCGYACAGCNSSDSARLTPTSPPITSVRSMSNAPRC
jgi:hypothetical protein